MYKHPGQLIGYSSRRNVLRSMAGFMITTMSIQGCAQSPSSSAAVPTPIPSRPGKVLYFYRGHTDRVTTVGWSPNGAYIASGSLDKTVQVRAVPLNKNSQPFIYKGHTDGVAAVDWSPDSQQIVSGSVDKTVRVWDALTGEHAALYQGHTDIVMTVAWSPDGKSIASGSADGTIRVWDVATAQQKYVYRGHSASVHSIAWSPDSQRIVSGAEDKTAQILDAASGNTLYTYPGHSNTVSAVSWSPNGKFIASGSWDKTVQVWNAMTGAVAFTYNGYNVQVAGADPGKGVLPDLIFAVAWSHNGKRIAAVTQEYCGDSCGVVLQWDAYTGHNLTFFANAPVFAIAYSPDDTRLATAIVVWTQGNAGMTVKTDEGAQINIVKAT